MRLQIVEGHLQFRYNLGSGEATARQETAAVDDNVFHEVSVRRTEELAEVVIDNRYVARSSSPGGETTLDIRSDAIYLGATVSAEGEVSQGFSGCLWSVKLDRKDLPVAAENQDFIPVVRSSEIDITCPGLGPLSESDPVPVGYIYGGLVGILAVLFLIVVAVVCCILGRQFYEKKKQSFRIDTGTGGEEEEGGGSPTAFAWRPAKTEDYRARNFDGSVSSGEFSGGNANMNNLNGRPIFLQPPSTSSLDATPAISETTFTDPEANLLPQRTHHHQHANPPRREQRQLAGRASGDREEMHVTNPGYMEDSPDSGHGAPRRAYRHRRPSSPPPIDLPLEEPTPVAQQQHRQPPQPASQSSQAASQPPQPVSQPPQPASQPPQPASRPPVAAKPSHANHRHQNRGIQRPISPIPVPIPEPRQQQEPRSPTQSPVEESTQPHHQRSLSSPDSVNPRQAAPFHPRHPTYSPTPSDDREEEEGITQVLHARSPSATSGHQSLGGKSDTSSLQDDVEVGKYIRKRIEEADFQVEEHNLDEMRPYKVEGDYEPLGSVGSLYDIIAEADRSTLGQSFSLSPDPTPVHSRDPSKSSMGGSSYMGDYGKKLDHLMERFHNLTASLSPEEYDEGRMV